MPIELPEIASSQVIAFVLVLARVGGLFLLAPIFSARALPLKAKLLAAGAISFALVPVATHGRELPTDALSTTAAIVGEAVVGLGFAFSIGVLLGAVQLAASLLDTMIGFSLGGVLDPFSGHQQGPLGQLYALFATTVLLLTGGDELMVRGLAESYTAVPLGALPSMAAFSALALDGFMRVFVIGLEIAAPVLIALVVTDAAFGLIGRAVPQMNVFVVELPAKVLVAFAVVGASLPFVAGHLQQELAHSVGVALQGLRIG